MSLQVITTNHPYSKYTEESRSLVDFLRTYCDQDKEVILTYYHELDDYLYSPNILCCLYDGMTGKDLKKVYYTFCNDVENFIIYQPTMKYLPDLSLRDSIDSLMEDVDVYLVTNNISFVSEKEHKRLVYTDSIHRNYSSGYGKNKGYELVILDLLEDTNLIHTKLSQETFIPYLDAQKSRKLEKKNDMFILTNLGLSSLKSSPQYLKDNRLHIHGMTWDYNSPEGFITPNDTVIYPSLKSKAFGRWAYLAKKREATVLSDHIHGYESFTGLPLQEAISNLP